MYESDRWRSGPGVLIVSEMGSKNDDEDSGVQAGGQRAGFTCDGECRLAELASVHPAGLNSFQRPSEMTSTLPSVTLMAV